MTRQHEKSARNDDEIDEQISWEPSIAFFKLGIHALVCGAAATVV